MVRSFWLLAHGGEAVALPNRQQATEKARKVPSSRPRPPSPSCPARTGTCVSGAGPFPFDDEDDGGCPITDGEIPFLEGLAGLASLAFAGSLFLFSKRTAKLGSCLSSTRLSLHQSRRWHHWLSAYLLLRPLELLLSRSLLPLFTCLHSTSLVLTRPHRTSLALAFPGPPFSPTRSGRTRCVTDLSLLPSLFPSRLF